MELKRTNGELIGTGDTILDIVLANKTNLRGANLQGANLQGVNLRGANLQGANLQGANLQGANLRGANLQGANLRGANLWGVNLRGANLQGANLWGANLRGANLRGAKGFNSFIFNPLLMLFDQPGYIRAYKLVKENGEGPFNGGIAFEVGKEYSVTNANCDWDTECGAGINVATLDWCLREYRLGFRILVMEFTAADIAAIPLTSDGKFRLHRCKVVGEKTLEEVGINEDS